MITVTKLFEFDAAHFLPEYDGACARLHGHTYRLEVEVEGERLQSPYPTMVVDFKVLKEAVEKNVIQILDHSLLNDQMLYPTAESIVNWIATRLSSSGEFKKYCITLRRVRVWETSDSYAEWKINVADPGYSPLSMKEGANESE